MHGHVKQISKTKKAQGRKEGLVIASRKRNSLFRTFLVDGLWVANLRRKIKKKYLKIRGPLKLKKDRRARALKNLVQID